MNFPKSLAASEAPTTCPEHRALIDGVVALDFAFHRDARGALIAFDHEQQLPFPLRRVFYMFDVPLDVQRGGHAVTADAVLIAVRGRVTIDLDNGREAVAFELNSPEQGLFVRAGVFLKLHAFRDEAMLLTLSSKLYSEVEYATHPFDPATWPSGASRSKQ